MVTPLEKRKFLQQWLTKHRRGSHTSVSWSQRKPEFENWVPKVRNLEQEKIPESKPWVPKQCRINSTNKHTMLMLAVRDAGVQSFGTVLCSAFMFQGFQRKEFVSECPVRVEGMFQED